MVKHSKRYKQIKINFLTQNRRTSLDLPLSGCTLAATFLPDCAQYHPTQPNQVQLFSECPSVLFWPLSTINRMWGQGIVLNLNSLSNGLSLCLSPVKPRMKLKSNKIQVFSFLSVRPKFSPGRFFLTWAGPKGRSWCQCSSSSALRRPAPLLPVL